MMEFLSSPNGQMNIWVVILLAGVVTFITRIAGHFVLAQFKTIHPRVEAALEAVPASVIVTLVMPQAVREGALEITALLIAIIASFYMRSFTVLLLALFVIIVGRALGF